MILEGRSGPSNERVNRGIDVAIMGARTLRTRSLPYLKRAQPARTRSGPQPSTSWWRIWHQPRSIAYRLWAICTQHKPKLGVTEFATLLPHLFGKALSLLTFPCIYSHACGPAGVPSAGEQRPAALVARLLSLFIRMIAVKYYRCKRNFGKFGSVVTERSCMRHRKSANRPLGFRENDQSRVFPKLA